MIDMNTGTAGATATEQAAVEKATAFLGGFAPGQPTTVEPTAAAPAVASAAPAEPPKAAEPTQDDLQKQALVEIMRETREARKAREVEDTRAKDLSAKYGEAQAEIERLKKANDFESDPIAFARARGWNKEQQALLGQMLLYDLVPDKAPPDLRIRLFESKQERDKREQSDRQEAEAKKAQAAQGQQQFNQFVAVLDHAVTQFDDGSYPESTAWFIDPTSGEVDRDNYIRSLIATANRMADEATRNQQVADLSPASIAKTLEAELAKRMKARETKVQKRTKPAQPVQGAPVQQGAVVAAGGVQPTESMKGLHGAGTPRPPAMTEEERVARAIAVLDRPRG